MTTRARRLLVLFVGGFLGTIWCELGKGEGVGIGDWAVRDGCYRSNGAGRCLYYLTDRPYLAYEGSV
jgi:hypothetical protein